MTTYEVYLHYPEKRRDTDTGIIVEYVRKHLQSFRTRHEAIGFADTQSLSSKDYVYVCQIENKKKSTEQTVYHRTLAK